MAQKNNYTKLADGTWGAFVGTGYKETAFEIHVGDTVKIETKGGEVHTRKISGIVKTYASGKIVTLEPDQEIARKANERYAAKVEANPHKSSHINQAKLHAAGKPCPKCYSYCYGDCEA